MSSHSSRILDHRELIHLDHLQASRLFLVVPPRPIAETLQHSGEPVRAADICRRTLDRELLLGQMLAATLDPGMLTKDPIPMPFERIGHIACEEPFAIVRSRSAQGVLSGRHRAGCYVPFLLYTREFRLCHLVLAHP